MAKPEQTPAAGMYQVSLQGRLLRVVDSKGLGLQGVNITKPKVKEDDTPREKAEKPEQKPLSRDWSEGRLLKPLPAQFRMDSEMRELSAIIQRCHYRCAGVC